MSKNFSRDKLRMLRDKTKVAAIAFILVLTMSATLMAGSVANAQQATIATHAFISVAPNPIGVGQSVQVTFWLNLYPPTAYGPSGDRWQNFTVTITKPSGDTQTMGPYTSDPVGSKYFQYSPDTVGTYYFQFSWPGQQIAAYGPYGNYIDAYYGPSTSSKVGLTVQQEPIPTYPEWPLPSPNQYWQRPINSENREWSKLSGNWLMSTCNPPWSAGSFNAYSTAPNTAHIVWTKPVYAGGVVGGQLGSASYANGFSYESPWSPPIIINGILYYNTPDPPRYGFYGVDLRTGETLFYQNTTAAATQIDYFQVQRWGAITLGQLYDYVSPNQGGVYPYLWGINGDVYNMYDAFTGNWILSIVNARTGTATYGPDGSLLIYILDGTNNWLAMWNSSKAIPPAGDSGTAVWLWRPDNTKTIDWANGVQWNVTIPQLPGLGPSITNINEGIIYARSTIDAIGAYLPSTVCDAGYNATTGQQLWVQNRTTKPSRTPGPMAEGVFTEWIPEEMAWYGYDIYTGNQLWGPTEPYNNAWGFYMSFNTDPIAYGKLYAAGYDGYVHCYDIKTGKHLWDFYTGSSGFETSYGIYPIYSWTGDNLLGAISVADGKIYATTGIFAPSSMSYVRGNRLWCVDAETGKNIWSILGTFLGPAVADGYLVTLNGEDNQIYCFGKGQTATTVTATPGVGNVVTIQGTVTDQSPGQTCLGIPAAGTPAISDASMEQWMEYLYMQKPMPTNATGVPVMLQATGSNGNTISIGTVTSNVNGQFKIAWAPPSNDLFTITASFGGSNSYFASSAETGLAVSAAASASSSASLDLYIIIATILIIIAIAIAVIILRRRK